MVKISLILLIPVGILLYCSNLSNGGEVTRRRVYFRRVKPTTADSVLGSRSQRGIISGPTYQDRVDEQHAAATGALEEATHSALARRTLEESLQSSIQFQQQQQQASGGYASVGQNQGAIRLVDQYGNVVQNQNQYQAVAHPQQGGYSQQSQRPQQIQAPGPQNAYLPPLVQPQGQQLQYGPPEVQPQQLQYGLPHVQYQPQTQLPQTQLIHQQQPVYQQAFTPEGTIIYQQIIPQPQSQVILPQPLYHHQHVHHQQPLVHYQHQTVDQVPIYHHQHFDHAHLLAAPQPQVHHVDVVQPLVQKIKPVEVVKHVEVLPSVKLVKQPILPPAVFQKEIFAVKNPPQRVLTYSDLCTTYPYQRKLAGCVHKKAVLPELHHPDIQLVPEETQRKQSSSQTGEGKLDPRTTALRQQNGNGGSSTQLGKQSETNNGKGEAGSIQDILGEVRDIEKSSSEESSDIAIVSGESANLADSTNKKEKLVIKTTVGKTSNPAVAASKIANAITKARANNNNNKSASKPKSKSSSSSKSTTAATTTSTEKSTTSTKKPKSKRRSRNGTQKNKNKAGVTKRTSENAAPSEQPFKLA